MKETEIIKWLKSNGNLDKVVNQFFLSQPRIAIFMAGIPGAGKTEFVDSLKEQELPFSSVIVEHDKLVEYLPKYKPENYYNYHKAGSLLVSQILKQCFANNYSFLLDGTLSHERGFSNIKQSLKKGYTAWVVYVTQLPQIAWEMTKKRELVTKRGVDKAGFIDTCSKINNNLLKIFDSFYGDSAFEFLCCNKKGQLSHIGAKMLKSHKPDQAKLIREILLKPCDISQLG